MFRYVPAIIASFLLFGFNTIPQGTGDEGAPAFAPAGPGLTEAFIDAATINALLDDRNCVGIRFYNVMATASAPATVMAIGIRQGTTPLNGGDIAAGWPARPYRMSMGISGPLVVVDKLSKSAAKDAVDRVTSAGHDAFNASFTKAECTMLLGVERCNGLRIAASTANGSNTMTVTSVAIADGRAEVLGSGVGYEKQCSDPCPAACPPPGDYISK